MREIDSTHNSEARLRQALRTLSANAPGEAPPQIGQALTGAFRRHHARRRTIRRATVAAVILSVVLPATVLLLVTERHRKQTPIQQAEVSPAANTQAKPAVAAVPSRMKRARNASSRNRVSAAAQSAMTTGDGFIDLPSSDQAVGGEDLRVIRLEVTGRALQMVGAPVAEESADNRMLADFIVGQDGTPYAVRLVR